MSTTSRSEHGDDFIPTEELVRRKGVKPVRSADELAQEDAFVSEEE